MRALLASVVLALLIATPAGAVELRAQTKSWPAAELTGVSLRVYAGEMVVEGSPDDHVRLTISVVCEHDGAARCQERAKEIEFDARSAGRELSIRVDRHSHWGNDRMHVRAELLVPRGLSLDLRMGAGSIDVAHVDSDLDVELGAGEIGVRMNQADVSRVHARVGVGDATLHTREGRVQGEGFISRSVRWTGGSGRAAIDASVGAGEVRLRLE